MSVFKVSAPLFVTFLLSMTASAITAPSVLAGEDCSNGNCDLNSTPVNYNSKGLVNPNTTNIGNSNSGYATGNTTQSQSSYMNNVQVNNSPTFAENAFGGGIECSDPSLSISGYTGAGGTGGVYSWGDTLSMGGAVSLNIPLGNGGKLCKQLATVVTTQRKLDTCLVLLQRNVSIDYALAPELEYCKAFKANTVVAPPMEVVTSPPVPEVVPEPPKYDNKTPIRALY